MGTLLDFASASRPYARLVARNTAGNSPQTGRSAEIIFFPGVRYEREALELAGRIGTIVSGAGKAPKEPR